MHNSQVFSICVDAGFDEYSGGLNFKRGIRHNIHMKKKILLQMGTNNWQRQGEFAPGSGILHEAHHLTYNQMSGVVCYSIYPSKLQTSDDPKVRIFKLDHDIPICESVSPVSTYRFHSMSEVEFQAYICLLYTSDAADE